MARMRALASCLALALLAGPIAAVAQELDEVMAEQARRARLIEAGRQAEQLRGRLESVEQDRLRQTYPQAPGEPKAEAPAPISAGQPPPAGRCDGFSRDMEAVIRDEARASTRAAMEQLTLRRQQIYQERLRAGC
jgi:hypothetical protein